MTAQRKGILVANVSPGWKPYVRRTNGLALEEDWADYQRKNRAANEAYEKEKDTVDRRYNPNGSRK